MIGLTLKLGIAVLNGGNAAVQQVTVMILKVTCKWKVRTLELLNGTECIFKL